MLHTCFLDAMSYLNEMILVFKAESIRLQKAVIVWILAFYLVVKLKLSDDSDELKDEFGHQCL